MLDKIIFLLVVLSFFAFAQEKKILLPKAVTITHNGNSQNLEVIPIEQSKVKAYNNTNTSHNFSNSDNPLQTIDTLFTVLDPLSFGSNFGFYGQDRMVQWFEAPMDLYLHEVGFAFYSAYVPVANVEMKVVAFKPYITVDSLEYLLNEWIGYYEAIGNGYHDVTAFWDDPDRIGPWTGINGHVEVFGNDIWSDLGVGLSFTPIGDSINRTYQFVDLSALGYPYLTAGTIFAVAIKNTAPILNSSRVGVWGTTVGTGGTNQFSLWKFYADDNTNQPPTTDWGWWSRDITLAFAAIVDIIIPVELINFTATAQADVITLNWSTATELNNLGFDVERRIINGKNQGTWHKLAFIPGTGTTTEIRNYSYIDHINGINTTTIAYRLKQIDLNGKSEYSEEVLVDNLIPKEFELSQNYPNPFNPETTIDFFTKENSDVTLIVFDVLGKEVVTLVSETMGPGSYSVSFNASYLPSGIYYYRMRANDFTSTKKLMVVK